MSREIKFRAWDAIDEVMVEWSYFRDEHHMDDLFSKELTLMQYTGLKDKNGVEIYEGDIVAVQGLRGEVIWDSERLRLAVRHNKGGTGMVPLLGAFEVIGNIYANPELASN